MREFLKVFELAFPFKFVLFDHNPEQLKIARTAKTQGQGSSRSSATGGAGKSATGGSTGTSTPINRGNEPTKMTVTKARLVGPECKPMCDRLLDWLSPRKMTPQEQAALQKLTGGYLSPILLVQWGPPVMGFTFEAILTSVNINYIRISSLGIPSHATVDLVLQEVPSALSLTNPTSGGRPGRARHMVTSDESLASIAQQAFGTPSAWRAIAEVNGIDDPSAIRPGDVVYLPAQEELSELVGARR
jgi:nucleoid-associated protein YgaU